LIINHPTAPLRRGKGDEMENIKKYFGLKKEQHWTFYRCKEAGRFWAVNTATRMRSHKCYNYEY